MGQVAHVGGAMLHPLIYDHVLNIHAMYTIEIRVSRRNITAQLYK